MTTIIITILILFLIEIIWRPRLDFFKKQDGTHCCWLWRNNLKKKHTRDYIILF